MKTILLAYLDKELLLSAAVASPLLTYVHKYMFSDWEFMVTFALALMLDFALGACYAYRTDNFSWAKAGRGIVKGIVLWGTLFIIHSAAYHETRPAISDAAKYLDGVAYWIFLGFELLSILKNARLLGINLPHKIDSLINKTTESVDKSKFEEIANHKDEKND